MPGFVAQHRPMDRRPTFQLQGRGAVALPTVECRRPAQLHLVGQWLWPHIVQPGGELQVKGESGVGRRAWVEGDGEQILPRL